MASRHAESLRAAAREARYSPLGQRAPGATRQRRLIIPSSLGLPALPDIRRKGSSAASALAEAMEAEAEVEAAAAAAEAAAAEAEAMVAEAEAEVTSKVTSAIASSRVCGLAPSFSTLSTASPGAMRSRAGRRVGGDGGGGGGGGGDGGGGDGGGEGGGGEGGGHGAVIEG